MRKSLVNDSGRMYQINFPRKIQLLAKTSLLLSSGLGISQRAAGRLQFSFIIGLTKSKRVLILVVNKAIKGAEDT